MPKCRIKVKRRQCECTRGLIHGKMSRGGADAWARALTFTIRGAEIPSAQDGEPRGLGVARHVATGGKAIALA